MHELSEAIQAVLQDLSSAALIYVLLYVPGAGPALRYVLSGLYCLISMGGLHC